MTLRTPTLLARDEGEHFHFLDNLFTAKVTGEMSNETLTAMEIVGPRNFGPPLHRHDPRTSCSTSSRARCGSPASVWRRCTAKAPWPGCRAGWPTSSDPLRDRAGLPDLHTRPVRAVRGQARPPRPAPGPVLPEPEEVDPAHVARVCAEFGIEVLGPPPPPVA